MKPHSSVLPILSDPVGSCQCCHAVPDGPVTGTADVRFSENSSPTRAKENVVQTGLVREVRRVRRLAALVTVVAAGACSGSSLASPDARLASKRDGIAVGPSGLEQRLTTQVLAPPAGSPYTAELVVTSTIVNTSAAAVKLTSRTCLFREEDIATTAKVDRFEPFISCGAVEATGDLGPGQSTPRMEVRFGVRSTTGTYTLELRHALSPQFRAETAFRIP